MKFPPNIIVQLIHIRGGLKGQVQEFIDPLITIGRLSSFILHFPGDEPGVSREHAKIQRFGNQFKLVALKDKFGTFVNGKQVREAVLRNGDVIEFGSGGPKVSFNAETCEPVAEKAQLPRFPSQPPAASLIDAQGIELQREEARPSLSAGGSGELAIGLLKHMDLPVQKTIAPLIIQFGPTIRTYRELPVLIGADACCDFVLQRSGIHEQHAQIFFNQDGYFVKDLACQRLLKVNGRPIEAAVRLNRFDEIECGPHGPVFRFLGEGRLAEVETAQSDGPFIQSMKDRNPEVYFSNLKRDSK